VISPPGSRCRATHTMNRGLTRRWIGSRARCRRGRAAPPPGPAPPPPGPRHPGRRPSPRPPGPTGPPRPGGPPAAPGGGPARPPRRSAELLTELLGTPPREVILTGGAARSTLWPQILADVLGLPIHVPGISESAAAGAAALAGLAIGARPRAATLAGPIPPTAPLAVPAPGQARRYDEPYAEWIRRTKRDK